MGVSECARFSFKFSSENPSVCNKITPNPERQSP